MIAAPFFVGVEYRRLGGLEKEVGKERKREELVWLEPKSWFPRKVFVGLFNQPLQTDHSSASLHCGC